MLSTTAPPWAALLQGPVLRAPIAAMFSPAPDPAGPCRFLIALMGWMPCRLIFLFSVNGDLVIAVDLCAKARIPASGSQAELEADFNIGYAPLC